MAKFHRFPRLPLELRAQVWEASIRARVVNVRVDDRSGRDGPLVLYLGSSTSVPAPLHTCREARNQGLYQMVFTELADPHYPTRALVRAYAPLGSLLTPSSSACNSPDDIAYLL